MSITSKGLRKRLKRKEAPPKQVQRTSRDKVVRRRIERSDYVRMLSQAENFPLLMRLAADLWKNGVTLSMFEDKLHLQEYGMSKQVYEYLTRMHFEQLAFERIPPYEPVYLRYPDEGVKGFKLNPGRPSVSEADEALERFRKLCVETGWQDSDFKDCLKRAVSALETPIKVFSLAHLRKTTDRMRDRQKQPEKTEPVSLKKLKVSSTRTTAANPKCNCCGHPLNTTFVTMVEEFETLYLHEACFRLTKAKNLIPGERHLDPRDGKTYRWDSVKGKWESEAPVDAPPAEPKPETPA